jgi:hypothetical protein
MALITYDMAVRHLKQDGVLDGSPDDADLTLKIEEASARVLVYLQRQGEWDADTDASDDPEFAIVRGLVLQVLSWLYRYRGDDAEAPGIETILNLETAGMLRDRTIA